MHIWDGNIFVISYWRKRHDRVCKVLIWIQICSLKGLLLLRKHYIPIPVSNWLNKKIKTFCLLFKMLHLIFNFYFLTQTLNCEKIANQSILLASTAYKISTYPYPALHTSFSNFLKKYFYPLTYYHVAYFLQAKATNKIWFIKTKGS